MAFKIVISNPEDGKSYKTEVDGAQAKRLKGARIGQTFKGDTIGMSGYELELTGGSNKAGFPMRKGVEGFGIKKVLLAGGVGYKGKDGMRKKKTVHTDQIDDDIVQINAKIVKTGEKTLEQIFGKKEEAPEGEKPAEESK